MTVLARCKFKVWEVKDVITKEDGTVTRQTIKLRAEYDPKDPVDTRFSEATPCGTFEFGLDNPMLIGEFERGDLFYLDLVPVGDK